MTAAFTLSTVTLALLGLPLFIVLGLGALIATRQMGLDPAVLIVELIRLAISPNLVAIPLFTFAGVALAAGGAPQRLVRLFNALVGWLPGGVAVVALLACAFFTAFSGGSGLTILALGGVLLPLLGAAGYPERFSLGLLTGSGSIGLLFPPSLPMLLYGVVAGVNIDTLFLAGLLPGLLLLALIAIYCMGVGGRRNVPRQPFDVRTLCAALKDGVWDVVLPVAVVWGIFGGYVTVGEAAACTAAYVVLLESVIHRSLLLRRQLFSILRETSVLVGSILIILGIAMGLTNLLVDAEVPVHMLEWAREHVKDQVQFLLLLNLMLLLVGAAMDIFSAIIVVVPLLLPLALEYGIDPVHLGIIVIANLEIGYLTPPVGMNLFIASQRFNKPMLSLFVASLPFLAIMLVWLFIVTYFPNQTMWYPSPEH